MFNKFKNGELVIISGIGKCNNTIYVNVQGSVLCRDPYFLDYNVVLENGEEDWFDGKYLTKIKGVEENENNILKNKRIQKV